MISFLPTPVFIKKKTAAEPIFSEFADCFFCIILFLTNQTRLCTYEAEQILNKIHTQSNFSIMFNFQVQISEIQYNKFTFNWPNRRNLLKKIFFVILMNALK